jgi:ABC-type antimicrobial peptide transport system permease subunit
MALGASRRGVIRLILREGFWMVLPGLVLGAAGSWAAARYVGSLLYDVKPLQPSICILSLAVLCGAALLACLQPARRAASVQPMEALRLE